jgi:hypothetical protein
MTLCPIALAVGCKKCPVFNVCPVKGAIGDYKPEAAPPPAKSGKSKPEAAPPAAKGRKSKPKK